MNIPQRARELAEAIQRRLPHDHLELIEAFATDVERDALERALNTRLILMGDWNEHDEEIFLCGVEERDRGIRALIDAPEPERPIQRWRWRSCSRPSSRHSFCEINAVFVRSRRGWLTAD